MKRTLSLCIAFFLVLSMIPLQAEAAQYEVQYFEDGSYLVTYILTTEDALYSSSKNGSKVNTFHAADGTVVWEVKLTGSFTYNGSSSSCTKASCSVSHYTSDWYTISKSSSKSGNTAYGDATIGEKVLGVTVRKVPVSLSLSCDANGKLS